MTLNTTVRQYEALIVDEARNGTDFSQYYSPETWVIRYMYPIFCTDLDSVVQSIMGSD